MTKGQKVRHLKPLEEGKKRKSEKIGHYDQSSKLTVDNYQESTRPYEILSHEVNGNRHH